MSDDEQHEQLTETRSWSEYDDDGNVTADHTTSRAICGTCYREQFDRRGHLEYVSADWPCAGAENARLRERVAALEAHRDEVERTWSMLDDIDVFIDPERAEERHAARNRMDYLMSDHARAALAGQEPAGEAS